MKTVTDPVFPGLPIGLLRDLHYGAILKHLKRMTTVSAEIIKNRAKGCALWPGDEAFLMRCTV
jgi:hypothetical protein